MVILQPNSYPKKGKEKQYIYMRDMLYSLALTRRKALEKFLKMNSPERGHSLHDSVETGLLNQFNALPIVKSIEESVATLVTNLNKITLLPLNRLGIPVVGKHKRAETYIGVKRKYWLEQADKVEMELDEQQDDMPADQLIAEREQVKAVRAQWGRPLEEIQKELVGTRILELARRPEGMPSSWAPSEFILENSLSALSLDPVLVELPELSNMFDFFRVTPLTGVEIKEIKNEVLHRLKDLQMARSIVGYIDFWTSQGHYLDVHVYPDEEPK